MENTAINLAKKPQTIDGARILVVEDDAEIGDLVERCLAAEGHHIHRAATGADALDKSNDIPLDLAIVDLGLPDLDGMILVRQFTSRYGIPVLVLSGLAQTAQRVRGLEEGADDYIPKPFEPEELVARVGASLRARRQASSGPTVSGKRIRVDDWIVDILRETLFDQDGRAIPLSNAEFKLLQALLDHPNKVLSRKHILNMTHTDMDTTERSVDIQVTRLRRKLEQNGTRPQLIRTVRRLGYMLVADRIEPID
ncbi:DNA-binding response regulator [Iodidimonas gelatinilytica]|uniref:Regulatory protein VirG n=1 Tax=Iodidimonas gelatinilytica TaxID=1236966 RepID=A0A5A7N1E0_9PROT|nr:response regulator transcription factor [Iodidimonas gelatinilytica]GER01504.1 DNA-binding response regulator [Iodidimonas gelatinilytica]